MDDLKTKIQEIHAKTIEHDNDLKKIRETLHKVEGRQSSYSLLLTMAEKIETNIDHIKEKLSENTQSLIYHIKRTNSLEDMVKPIWKIWVFARISAYLLGLIATIIGLLAYFEKL